LSPLRRSRARSSLNRPRRRGRWSFMWLVALQSFIGTAVAWPLGYLLPPRAPCFHRPCGLPSDTGPRSLARPGSSSPELYVHFKVRSLCSPARRRCAEHLPRFRPSTRLQRSESTTRRAPTLTFVPPTAFLALSTAYSSPHLAGLFHPAATSGVHPSGGFPAT